MKIKYIIRCDYGNNHCWWVRIGPRTQGFYFQKSFPDKFFGSKKKSLAAAVKFKNSSLAILKLAHWEGKKPKGHHKKPTVKSTTGIVGVFNRYDSHGNEVWVASYYPVKYKCHVKSFSVNVYGDRARLLAIEARRKGLESVEPNRR